MEGHDDDPSLLRGLYAKLHVSPKDQEHLRQQCGITNLATLRRQRSLLAHNQAHSRVCRRLVAAIDFLRPNSGMDTSTLLSSHSNSSPSAANKSWEHFLALRVVRARQGHSSHHPGNVPSVTAASKRRSDTTPKQEPPQKKFKQGDQYWIDKYSSAVHQSEDEDDEDGYSNNVVRLLGLDEASPWKYESATEEVVLKGPHETSTRLPVGLFRKLYPYQREGVAWMAGLYHQKIGGILADEPGMGKTIQTLSHITSLLHTGTIRNALIVCPKSNLETTWVREADALFRYFPWDKDHRAQPRIVMLDPTWSNYQMKQALLVARTCSTNQPHLVIASYPQIERHYRAFNPGTKRNNFFDFVVLDEAHNVKNPKAQKRDRLNKIGKHSARLMLTGTPFMNDLKEIHSLMEYVTGITVLGTITKFNEWYKKPIERGRKPDALTYEKKRGNEVTEKLVQACSPYILKRVKSDHLQETVPDHSLFDVWTRLSKAQRNIYQAELDSLGVDERRSGGQVVQNWALPAIRRLREICMHPAVYLIKEGTDGAFRNTLRSSWNAADLVSQSPKLNLTINLLLQWRQKGLKSLVFCESTKMLAIIEYVLESFEGIDTCRIDGGTSKNRRKTLVDDFNATGSRYNVLLLSMGAGGEGLTLTGANKSIIYDPPWNQARQDQAAARISRPGQTRKTECIQLIAAGTVEERMFGKQVWKGAMDRTVIGDVARDRSDASSSSGYGGQQRRLFDKDELTQLFTLDPDGVCESLDKLQQSQVGDWTKKCSTSKAESSVIGISLRSRVYGV